MMLEEKLNQTPQLDLFEHVLSAYGQFNGLASNESLYRVVAAKAGIPEEDVERKEKIGQSGQKHSLVKRAIRWHQQTLKRFGLIEHVPGERGLWQLTEQGKHKLHRASPGVALVAFSTDLGIAIWGNCEDVFSQIGLPIALCLTSPPYPLRKPRAYGNPPESEYVDFICRSLEPIVRNLIPGGSICLNVSNDIFIPGSPARSLYRERMAIALYERLGLYKMDEIIWSNPSKPPGPVQWASLNRVQLNTGYEPIYWFTNDPWKAMSIVNNKRVLEPHTEKHLKFIENGGVRAANSTSDGAYTLKVGAYSNPTPGRIPKNVITRGQSCADANAYRKSAKALGLPVHGATFPLSLAEFAIKLTTEVGQLVVDLFGGRLTVGKAAEINNRPWVSSECMWEYARGGAEGFKDCAGFWLNPQFSGLL